MNAKTKNKLYSKLYQTIQKQWRLFLTVLRVQMFITECSLSNKEKLLFWERWWVLNSKLFHMRLIQYTHNSTMTEHSKRNVTDALLLWQFFWLKILQNVYIFCWNCNKCHTNNSWKNCWQSFLKSLSVSERIWWKIFIDFVIDLSLSESCMNLLIIINCLNKEIILKSYQKMTAEWVAQIFIQCFYWAHRLSTVIVSD